MTVQYGTTNGSATSPGDFTAVAGSTLTFNPGETSKNAAVTIVGDAACEPAPAETFTVGLSAETNATIADGSATATIVDDDCIPSISIADATRNPEGNANSTLTFAVTLSEASSSTVTVAYATGNGTATGPDFVAGSGVVSFAAGEVSKNVSVTIVGDLLDEPDEQFSITLSSPTGATILDGDATGTIVDDDATPTLSIADASTTEGNSGTKNLTFTVSLSAPSGRTVTVAWATADGTAGAPGDFTSGGATLTFDPGDTSKTLNVALVGDTTCESSEGFTVGLSSPSNATILDGSGAGTITDDDCNLTLSILDKAKNPEGNANGSLTFTVTLSAASGSAVSVDYATSDGTATGPDYTAKSGTLTFAPGVTSQTFTVTIVGDTLDEPDETFFVTLVERCRRHDRRCHRRGHDRRRRRAPPPLDQRRQRRPRATAARRA